MKTCNSFYKEESAKSIARKRKEFIKRYSAVFAELGVKPFAGKA